MSNEVILHPNRNKNNYASNYKTFVCQLRDGRHSTQFGLSPLLPSLATRAAPTSGPLLNLSCKLCLQKFMFSLLTAQSAGSSAVVSPADDHHHPAEPPSAASSFLGNVPQFFVVALPTALRAPLPPRLRRFLLPRSQSVIRSLAFASFVRWSRFYEPCSVEANRSLVPRLHSRKLTLE